MLRFGGNWIEHREKLYASDRHFYMVFSAWFDGRQKEAVMYIQNNIDSMPIMDAKKLIVDIVGTYAESHIKGRLDYIEEQFPESIV